MTMWLRSSPAIVLVIACSCVWALGCGDGSDAAGDPYRHDAYPHRPRHFMDPCGGDAGTCKDPYECLPTMFRDDAGICSIPCDKSSDCPHWSESGGHCQGDVQAQCIDHVCQAWCV
jgi:hypothetical protein